MNPLGNAENISFSVICTTQDVTEVSEGGMISSSVETVSLDENVSSRSLVSRQSTVSGGEFYFRDAVLTADCFFLLIDQVDQIGEWTDEEVAITVSSLRAVCKVFKGYIDRPTGLFFRNTRRFIDRMPGDRLFQICVGSISNRPYAQINCDLLELILSYRYMEKIEKIKPDLLDWIARTPLVTTQNVLRLCGRHHFNIIKRNKRGQTPLHVATKYNNNGYIFWVLRYAESIYNGLALRIILKEKDRKGKTSLDIAISKNNKEIIILFLEYLTDSDLIRCLNNKLENAPLHNAVCRGDHECIVALLSDPEQLSRILMTCKNAEGKTPLDIAIEKRDGRAIEVLLNYVTDIQWIVRYMELIHEKMESLSGRTLEIEKNLEGVEAVRLHAIIDQNKLYIEQLESIMINLIESYRQLDG